MEACDGREMAERGTRRNKCRLPLSRVLGCVAGYERGAGEFRSGPTSSTSGSPVINPGGDRADAPS